MKQRIPRESMRSRSSEYKCADTFINYEKSFNKLLS